MVITIDGPAGSGKSTIAKLIAKRLGFLYINSGAFYRALTLACLRAGVDPSVPELTTPLAIKIKLSYDERSIYLDGEAVDYLLHSDQIDQHVAQLSAIVPVRHVVNDMIRQVSQGKNIVVEGRDMATVVFPDAEYKFYLDASVKTRAYRRFQQGVSNLSLEEIKHSIEKRDQIDQNKPEGSLKVALGAVYLDCSDLTIDEVYDKLIEKIQIEGSNMGQMEVSVEGAKVPLDNIQTQLQEEYLKSLEQLEEGQLIDGVVVQVTSDQVFVDVGYKSEGKIPIAEFSEIPKIGEPVSVVLVSKENKHGEVIVSKQKADIKVFWKNLRHAFHEHMTLEGTIDKLVKGGYEVNLGFGVRAFLPISQADAQKVDKPEKLVGMQVSFYIERLYSDGKINIVVNRRKCLEEKIEKRREDFYTNTQTGDEVVGIVKSFTSFGSFVDLGGFDGLLHINDMSWGHVTRPKDFVKKGQEIRLKVIRIDPVEKRINLSLKHFTDDPWVHFEDKYHVNDIVNGHVTKLTDFGAFIELEEGIEGLAHISEFSWIKKVQKPEEVLKIGDGVECMVLGYDLQAGRVSLGLKQVTANPWTDIDKSYPVGTRLTRKIVKLTNAGAFIELEDGIDGFLHIDDISWTKKLKHPGSEYQIGQEIDVMVIAVESENRNIRLGVKQLSDDPWKSFSASHSVGSAVEGEVSSVTDFGIFVRIPGGIEGLIHKSNLVQNREDSPEEVLKKYTVGDKMKAVIIEIQPEKQKIAFSIRDYEKKVQREELSKYMAEEESNESTYTLGDFIKSKGNKHGS